MPTIFLDTNTLYVLSSLENELLNHLKEWIDRNDVKLYTAYIQIDDMYSEEPSGYRTATESALKQLKTKGIMVKSTDTKGIIFDISRLDLAEFSNDILDQVYDKLRNKLADETKRKGKNVNQLNMSRDASVALTSLDFDYFITCNKTLGETTEKIFNEDKDVLLREDKKIPQIYYTKAEPSEIAKAILTCAF